MSISGVSGSGGVSALSQQIQKQVQVDTAAQTDQTQRIGRVFHHGTGHAPPVEKPTIIPAAEIGGSAAAIDQTV